MQWLALMLGCLFFITNQELPHEIPLDTSADKSSTAPDFIESAGLPLEDLLPRTSIGEIQFEPIPGSTSTLASYPYDLILENMPRSVWLEIEGSWYYHAAHSTANAADRIGVTFPSKFKTHGLPPQTVILRIGLSPRGIRVGEGKSTDITLVHDKSVTFDFIREFGGTPVLRTRNGAEVVIRPIPAPPISPASSFSQFRSSDSGHNVSEHTATQSRHELAVQPISTSSDRIDFELRRSIESNTIQAFAVGRPAGTPNDDYHDNLLSATCSTTTFALLKNEAFLLCQAEIEFVSPSGKADSIKFPEMKFALERGTAQTQNNHVTFQLKLAAKELEAFLGSNNSEAAATPGAKPLSLRDFLTTVVLPNSEHVRVGVKLVQAKLRFAESIDNNEQVADFPVEQDKPFFLYLKVHRVGAAP
ncbi:MAG: hypothetical protein JNL67_03150 [Planctomycetaceae bacterium]|nr:hypothetical protein [Planctomycetaceae bacterium]